MYHFIVNPHSRSKMGQEIWNEVETILVNRQIEYKVYFTKFQKHATRLVAEITANGGEHTIVVLGGDGTVNEVINGIADFARVTLGYIPTGSSNDFARSLSLPATPSKALDVILRQPNITLMDVGELHYHNQKKRFFGVSAGIGFDASVCHQAVVSKLKLFLNRIRLGKLTYAGIAISQLFGTSPGGMTVTLDCREPLHFEKVYFTAIMNQRYEGGGFMFCPKAESNDRKLDVIMIEGLSKLAILLLLPTAFLGKHTFSKNAHIFQCSIVTIESEKPLPVHTDGEPIYLQSKIFASCAAHQLRIITP